MNKIPAILKKIWKGWCYLCGGLGIIFVIAFALLASKQSAKDETFTKENLIPLASFVEKFRDSKGHLPSEVEFNSWAETNFENKAVWYYTNKPNFMRTWGISGKDFIVGAWRGEWIQYFSSWDKKSFSE